MKFQFQLFEKKKKVLFLGSPSFYGNTSPTDVASSLSLPKYPHCTLAFALFSLPCPPTACHVVHFANLRGDDRYTHLPHWRTLNSNHGPPFYPLSYRMRILASVGIPFVLILIIKWKNLYLFHLLINFIFFFSILLDRKKRKKIKRKWKGWDRFVGSRELAFRFSSAAVFRLRRRRVGPESAFC